MEKTIVEMVYNNSIQNKERLFLVDNIKAYTYEDGWKEICKAYERLLDMNVKKGDCILTECTQDARFIFCDFACNLIGAYFVPIEHKASLDRIVSIAEETEALLYITEDEIDVPCSCVLFSNIFDDEYILKNTSYEFPKLDDTAEILYTTGTTGKSKGIEITHLNNIALAENISFGTKMREGNVELIPLPLSHSHALRCLYANLYRNGTVIIKDGVIRVKEIYDAIKNYNVTAMDLSPTAVSVLLRLSRGKFSEFNNQLDYIQIGTAPLPEETKEALIEQFKNVRLYNFYGSTESGRSCVLDFNSDENKKYCVGLPTKNAHFIVVDDNGNEIKSSKDNTGLLACAGKMNMKGYWKMPELTEKTIINGYIFSQDESYIDEEGYVYVLGRKSDIINYKGIKIAPEEIESAAEGFKGLVDCACVPMEDSVAGQVPKLFVSVKNKEKFDKKEFLDYISSHIDGNKMPKLVEIIDEIPRTSNGKLQRNKLK